MPSSVYLHVPFCTRRCGYCDFNVDVRDRHRATGEDLFAGYVRSLMLEADLRMKNPHWKDSGQLNTLYFGGGTPSLLGPELIAQSIEGLRSRWGIAVDAEVTIELNPEEGAPTTLTSLREAGVNRLSIGVQSFNDAELAKLSRTHDANMAESAICAAFEAGFHDISIDLMFGIPGQTTDSWSKSLDTTLRLAPQHISLYDLSIERRTRFASLHRRGLLDLPSEQTQLDFWRHLFERMRQAGYHRYEISNWCLQGHESRHNLAIWRGGPYLALGAGAHGYENFPGSRPRRYWNLRPTDKWMNRACAAPEEGSEHPNNEQQVLEWLLTSWRLAAGITPQAARARLGGRDLPELLPHTWREWTKRAWVHPGPPWRWTEAGSLLCDLMLTEMCEAI